jgi:type II secretory pathway pseudopilin PulG
MKRHRKGFGLLEIILVFAIIIGAGAIVFSVFSNAQDKALVSHGVDQMNLVVANTRAYAATNRQGYTLFQQARADPTFWVKAGIISTEMEAPLPARYGATPLGKNIFGGEIYAGVCPGCTPITFTIEFGGLTSNQCTLMASQIFSFYSDKRSSTVILINSGSNGTNGLPGEFNPNGSCSLPDTNGTGANSVGVSLQW